MTFAARRAAALAAAGSSFLITHLTNIRYLTGFTGSNAVLLLAEEPRFFTDGRYIEQSREQVPDLERTIVTSGSLEPAVKEALDGLGVRRLGFEAAHTTVAAWRKRAEAFEGVSLVETVDVVEGLRARKSASEVDAIRRAQRIAEAAVTSVLGDSGSGLTEAQLALALETAIRRSGGSGVSFDVIVATGAHAALPHGRPRDVAVASDGVLLIDIGAVVDGYCSDMTRTYLRGACPDPLPKVHAAVVRALEAACSVVRPGVKASDVDRAARDVLAAEGLADAFTHSTGHGVGLDIHEAPRLSKESEAVLEAGMVITIEPGVYLAGVGGVRVEDMLLVTEDGYENLTSLPRA